MKQLSPETIEKLRKIPEIRELQEYIDSIVEHRNSLSHIDTTYPDTVPAKVIAAKMAVEDLREILHPIMNYEKKPKAVSTNEYNVM